MYDVQRGLIWKRVVDFLLVVIEIFSLGGTAEALRTNISSKSAISLQRGSVDPKFQVEGVAPLHQPFFSQKTRINDFAWYKNLDTFFPFCHNARVWQMDGRRELFAS